MLYSEVYIYTVLVRCVYILYSARCIYRRYREAYIYRIVRCIYILYSEVDGMDYTVRSSVSPVPDQ